MSQLIYNGVTLDFLKTNSITRTAVLSPERSDLVGYRWEFDVVTLYAGGWPGDQVASPVINDFALRLLLMQPHKTLIYQHNPAPAAAGGPVPAVLLRSPRPGYRTDVEDGPKPISCDIIRVAGQSKTLIVNYRIETTVNECPETTDLGGVRPLMVLSHRWTQSFSVDEDYFTVRQTAGELVLNSEWYNNSPANLPDQLRSSLFFPIPPFFKRVGIHVEQSPNKTSYRYVVLDKEESMGFLDDNPAQPPGLMRSPNASRVEIQRRMVYASDQDAATGILNVIPDLYWTMRDKREKNEPDIKMAAPAGGGGPIAAGLQAGRALKKAIARRRGRP